MAIVEVTGVGDTVTFGSVEIPDDVLEDAKGAAPIITWGENCINLQFGSEDGLTIHISGGHA